ncbi:hypothetical protein D3C81_1845450 [compost metagenome]
MRWHIAAQALEMTEVIEPHAKHPGTRLQRRKQPCRGQRQPLVVQIKHVHHQPRAQPGPVCERRIDPAQAISLRVE